MLTWTDIVHAVSNECAADRVWDDVTAGLLGPEGQQPAIGCIKSRQNGVFSGTSVVSAFNEIFQGQASFKVLAAEGAILGKDTPVVEVRSTFQTCLSLERTLLNYLCHLSGVATLTRAFVDAVKPHPTKILATRKTLPGLKELQLQAVKAGGGHIHRRNLSDGILFKENHQAFVSAEKLLERARISRSPLHGVEIEIQDLKLLDKILENPPDVIMLDNISQSELGKAIATIREKTAGKTKIEISGGMTVEKVKAIASLGADFISVGQLTHSAPVLNLSMDIEKA